MSADKKMRWPALSHEVLGSGTISSFVEETVETPTGELLKRQFLTHPGAVAIVAWDEEGDRIAVVRQYRHPVRMELVEIPAGLLDVDGEDYQQAAARELAEEAQLQAGRWNTLVDLFTTPGACAETLRVFLARDLSAAPLPEGFVADGEEAVMTAGFEKRETLVRWILEGRCQSPSLVAGVLALQVAILSGTLEGLRGADVPWDARKP